MKYFKAWLPIPINWTLSFIYFVLASLYIDGFIGPDFYLGIAGYHYGYCSLAITISLLLLLLSFKWEKRIKKNEGDRSLRIQIIIVKIILSITCIFEILFYLDWYAYFLAFDIFR